MNRPCGLALLLALLANAPAAVGAVSATALEDIYQGAYRAVAGNDCNDLTAGDEDCSAGLAAQRMKALQAIPEAQTYRKLAEAKLAQVECAMERQRSILAGKDVPKLMLGQINEMLPALDWLKAEAARMVSENQLLKGKIPHHDTSKPLAAQYRPLQAEYDQRNQSIQSLIAEYERLIATVPNSDAPAVRKMLEDRLSGPTSSLKLMSEGDFKRMQEAAMSELLRAQFELVLATGSESAKYPLNLERRHQIATDGELIGAHLSQHPGDRGPIELLQCRVRQQVRGSELLDAGLTVGSVALPAAVWGLVWAGRVKYAAQFPRAAEKLQRLGKVVGLAGVVVGSAQSAIEIAKACFPKADKSSKQGAACTVSVESVLKAEEETSCMTAGLWAASPVLSAGAALVAGKLASAAGKLVAERNKALAEFLEKNKAKAAKGSARAQAKADREAQDLHGASGLLDEDRVLAAPAVLESLGRSGPLTRAEAKAVVEAHKVGLERGYGRYTKEDIAQKKAILRAAGFRDREIAVLMQKGIVGNFAEATAVAPEAIAEAMKLSRRGFPTGLRTTDDLADPRVVQRLEQEASYLAGDLTRALNSPGNAKDVQIAATAKLDEINLAIPLHPTMKLELNRAKNELLRVRYFGSLHFNPLAKDAFAGTPSKDLAKIIAELEPMVKADKARFSAEANLLEIVKREHGSRPDVLDATRQGIQRTGDELKVAALRAEMTRRAALTNPAAHPFTEREGDYLRALTAKLRDNPQNLTRDEREIVDELAAKVAAKRDFEGGKGFLLDTDRRTAAAFEQAWERARAYGRQVPSHEGLAGTQGRTLNGFESQQNVPVAGQVARVARQSVHGDRSWVRTDPHQFIFQRFGNGRPRPELKPFLKFDPIVVGEAPMAALSSKLNSVGIPREQLDTLNVASSFEPINFSQIPNFEHVLQLNQTFTKRRAEIAALAREGKLTEAEVDMVRKLIETAQKSSQNYRPPHQQFDPFK